MRLSLIALLALLLCLAHAKPLDNSNEEGDKDSTDVTEPEKKDTTESTEEKDTSSDEENSDENSDEKKDDVEASPSEDEEPSDDDSKSNENASETSSETPSEDSKPAEVEEDENPDEGSKKDEVPAKKSKPTKKWWLVGDHWGGWGHSNWGHPQPHHEGGGWQWGHHGLHHGGHGGGHHKSLIAHCCKSVDPEVTKRCGCTTNHHGGYHFTDHGSGHDDHDHDIHGPWSFGYNNFGDDWGDWDHNHHNFEHVSHMEHLPHDDHGCGGHGRGCVPYAAQPFSQFYPSLRLTAPVGFGYGNAGFGGIGYGGYGGAGYGGYGGEGYGGYGGNNYGVYGYNGFPVHKVNDYRVCHKCHDLPHGGSRCLCKSVRHHPLYLPVVHRPAHVYVDCDTSVHKFPHNRCVARADIPLPESEATESGSARQGAVYPYVGYGPWSAYPWWGDWWGGHGHHAWGEGQGCGHGGGGQGGVGHGGGHGGGNGGGHGGGHVGGCGGGHHMGRQVGFSFGGHGGGGVGGGAGGGGHLQAYHCKDSVEKSGSVEGKTKRFCVPIGHHGGYGWPYWHGYPGVGTGLWGWGWPWIKNKVPGSKGASKEAGASDEKKESKKSSILTALPATHKDVTGTKRDMGFSQGPQGTGSMLGHPVTHPGYTTMGFPGHGDSSIEAQKDQIPQTKKSA